MYTPKRKRNLLDFKHKREIIDTAMKYPKSTQKKITDYFSISIETFEASLHKVCKYLARKRLKVGSSVSSAHILRYFNNNLLFLCSKF